MMNRQSDTPTPSTDHPLTEKRITTTQVFRGKLLDVWLDEVRLPDGTTSTREWIKHPGACAVVPLFQDGTIMLLEQYRYPAGITFLEVPAGKIDPGEDPLETARRELLEESGIRCQHLKKTGFFYPAIGYANEIIHSYVAWDLTVESQNVDADEFLRPLRIPFSEALKWIETGKLSDAKTITTLIQVKQWWREHGSFKVNLGG